MSVEMKCVKCGHDQFRSFKTGHCSELLNWYEGTYCDCKCEFPAPSVDRVTTGDTDGLPSVGGRRLTEWTIAEFERNCQILLRDEQQKPNCDTRLVSVLCNATRLAREQTDMAHEPLAVDIEGEQEAGEQKSCVMCSCLRQFSLRHSGELVSESSVPDVQGKLVFWPCADGGDHDSCAGSKVIECPCDCHKVALLDGQPEEDQQ